MRCSGRALFRLAAPASVFCVLAVPASSADLTGTVQVSGTPAQHVIVWLEVSGTAGPSEPHKVVLDQRNLAFQPRVLAVRVGTTVEFPNNDKVFHNVFSHRDGKKFDLGMYPKGVVKRIVFDRPGLARVFCNIHPNMAAYILAVDSPYFAVSDERGVFDIAGIPTGTYTYHAWRPGGRELTGAVTVDGYQPLEIRW
jgi:plastocyanin